MPPLPSETGSSDAPQTPEHALAVELLDVRWEPRPGVIVSETKTYGCGLGSEYVYCYSYPTYVEMAQLKNEERYRIKVGKADGDPIERVRQQVAGNKTAISETPVVLLVFQTLAGRHLERWLHNRLERVDDAGGYEWFHTNPDELVGLFGSYLRDASSPSHDPTELEVPNAVPKVVSKPRSSRAEWKSGPATSPTDVVICLKPWWPRAGGSVGAHSEEGHRVQACLNRMEPISVGELVAETGLPLDRVLEHVNFEMNVRKRARLEDLSSHEGRPPAPQ